MALFPGTKTGFNHGSSGYSNHGCRCAICKDAKKALREKDKNKFMGTEPPSHGTLRAYQTYKCRCEICVSFKTNWQKQRRSEKIGTEPPVHGNTGYWLYGCRCSVCVGERKISDLKRQLNPEVIKKEKERSWERQGIKDFSYNDYCHMYEEQNGSCAICGGHMETRTLRDSKIKRTKTANVDHDHDTGKVRSLLCNNCNKMVGLGGTSDVLRKGADYLDKFKGDII